jgi:hypothetical protein
VGGNWPQAALWSGHPRNGHEAVLRVSCLQSIERSGVVMVPVCNNVTWDHTTGQSRDVTNRACTYVQTLSLTHDVRTSINVTICNHSHACTLCPERIYSHTNFRGSPNVRNFPCQTLKLSKVSLVITICPAGGRPIGRLGSGRPQGVIGVFLVTYPNNYINKC